MTSTVRTVPLPEVWVPDDDPGQVGKHPRIAIRFLPNRSLAFLDVTLIQREPPEADVPVSAGLEASQQVVVRYSGKRAAVIPGDSET